MALVAAVLKLTVAAAVAVLRSVRSSRLWCLSVSSTATSHTNFVSRDEGKGNDGNDDYRADATWHPVSSVTLHFGTPCEDFFLSLIHI